MKQITEQAILKARNYLPLKRKEELAEKIAEKCLEIINVNVDDGENLRSIPPMVREDYSKKVRYLMGIFAGEYLSYKFTPDKGDDTGCLMSETAYDMYASAHVFDQLERIKRTSGTDPEVKNRIFEIMSDYRDLEKRINSGIYSLISVHNDVCSRLMAMMEAQVTPEALSRAGDALEQVKEELRDYAEAKKGAVNG